MVLLRCTADPQNTVSGLKKRISAVSRAQSHGSKELWDMGLSLCRCNFSTFRFRIWGVCWKDLMTQQKSFKLLTLNWCLVPFRVRNRLLYFPVKAHTTQVLSVHWQVSLLYYHMKNRGLRVMTNTLIRRWKANMNVLYVFWGCENPYKRVVVTDSVEAA